jgi:hypothetical protein
VRAASRFADTIGRSGVPFVMTLDASHASPSTNGNTAPNPSANDVPVGTLKNLPKYFGHDVPAGFPGFVIALPQACPTFPPATPCRMALPS